jgi:hypothetical protein
MSVEFNEGNNLSQRPNFEQKNSKMVDFLIKRGLAKDESGANKILIVSAIVFFVLSLYFFFF